MAAKKKKPAFEPYTMHCPKCKTGIRIKKPELIGTRINCPKCTKKIDVVTPEEDGYIAYGVEQAPPPEPEPEPTEEELLEMEMERKRKKRKELAKKGYFALTILFYLAVLGGVCWAFWEFVIKDYGKKKDENAAVRIVDHPWA